MTRLSCPPHVGQLNLGPSAIDRLRDLQGHPSIEHHSLPAWPDLINGIQNAASLLIAEKVVDLEY